MSSYSDKSSKYLDDICMVWNDLSFTGTALIGLKSHLILNSISGYIKFGSLNALMGPSGSGKSTFLKCINGQNSNGLSKETELYLNKTKAIRPCFIVQDVSEHLLNGLTAKQMLMYASKLKNSEENFKVDHKNNIKKLMEELMISDTADTRIDKCSGGEQKRIAIAAELTAIKMPNLLCIDEPTSGLDSNAAEIVIRCLKNLAIKHHIAIVTSIHQPNADILLMFDQLYVLSKGGKCVFAGSPFVVGEHLKLSSIQCKSYQVPIEVLIKHASKGLKDTDVRELLTRNYDRNKSFIHKYRDECQLSMNGIRRKQNKFRVSSFWHLLFRTLINTVKSQGFTLIFQTLLFSSYGSILAWIGNPNIGKADACISLEDSDRNRSAAEVCRSRAAELDSQWLIDQNLTFMFCMSGLLQFLQVVATTVTFNSEIKVFLNEHRNGWYSTSSYYWAKSLVELPLPILVAIANSSLSYYFTNQFDEQFRLNGMIAYTALCLLVIQSYGFLSCIIFGRNMPLAMSISIVIFLVNLFFCGFFVPILEMHDLLQTLSRWSSLQQAFQSTTIFVYGFDRCPSGSFSWALQQFELHVDQRPKLWINLAVIVAHFVAMRVVVLGALIQKAKPKQKKYISPVEDELEIDSDSNYSVEKF